MTILVFTGTRKGITYLQATGVWNYLRQHPEITCLRHGCCVGADARMHWIMRQHNPQVTIVGHPSNRPDQTDPLVKQRCDLLRDPADPLARNHTMLHAADLVLACPRGPEVQRSGTWATIRYARKANLPVTIIYPAGNVIQEQRRHERRQAP